MKLYLKLNDISDSMIVFQNRQNSQILIQFNPLHCIRESHLRENLRACKICLCVPICLQGLHIAACSESVFSFSPGKEGRRPWRTNSASLPNKLQEPLVTLGWQLGIAGQCLLHLFLGVIQWAGASGGGHAFGRVHGVKEAVGHGRLKNTGGYLQNRKNNQRLFTD